MGQGLDVIILDDDEHSCDVVQKLVQSFYTWGQVHAFTDFLEARTYCFNRESGLAVFVLDVFLGEQTAFDFIEAIKVHYPLAAEDTVIITGQADEDIVDMCMAQGINHLLEKPVRRFAFQFAIRAIAGKYLRFAKQLMQDPDLATAVEGLESPGVG